MPNKNVREVIGILESFFNYPAFLPAINHGQEEDKWRRGGYLCIMDVTNPAPILGLVVFGKIPIGKSERYCFNAQEKARRLFTLRDTERNLSSWQSRDPELGQWGGAIRAGNSILSFSGFLEPEDQASMVLLATASECIEDHIAGRIVSLSGDREESYFPLAQAMKDHPLFREKFKTR